MFNIFKVKRRKQRRVRPRKYLADHPGLEASKSAAFDLVIELINEVLKCNHFDFNSVRIKDQRTRWGSCSSKKNLNFNYRILYLPRELAKYLVVHELCHLKEMNHSKAYWACVEEILPNYKELNNELKKYAIK